MTIGDNKGMQIMNTKEKKSVPCLRDQTELSVLKNKCENVGEATRLLIASYRRTFVEKDHLQRRVRKD